MKKTTTYRVSLIAAAGALLLTLLVASCDSLLPVSLNDRISSFIADINLSSSNTYMNFSQMKTAQYSELKGYNWTTPFPAGTYVLSNLDTSDETAVTATISGPTNFFGPKTITFKMSKEGSFLSTIYYIEELTLDGDVLIQ